jgi:hypothetical protein
MKEDVSAYETVLGKNEHTKKYRMLLEIVDSQAQKIARLEYTVSDKSDMLTGVAGLHKEACEEIEKQAQKISEQAKEIAKLKRQISGNFEPEDFHNQILQDSDPLGQEFR